MSEQERREAEQDEELRQWVDEVFKLSERAPNGAPRGRRPYRCPWRK